MNNQTAKTEHTPTPWAIQHFGPFDDIFITTLRNESRIPIFESVAEVWMKNGTTQKCAVANAAFIVEAVNNHARLTARVGELEVALREAKDRFSAMALDAHVSENTIRAIASTGAQHCRAALAATEGGQ